MSTLHANRPRALNLKTAVFSLLLSTSMFSSVYSIPLLAENTQAELHAADPILQQAKALNAQGKFKEALALLKSAPMSQSTFSAMISTLANTDMDDAEELANKAVKAFPDSAELHYLRGVIMGNQAQSSIFSALGYAEKSLNSFIKATELEPTTIKYRKALMSFYLAAPSIAGGDEELALEQLQVIQKADELEGASSQVSFYLMTDEPDKAIQALQKAIQALQKAIIDFPSEVNFVFRLAAYYAQEEDYKKAMPLFEQAAAMPLPEFAIDPVTGNTQASYVRNASAKFNALYQIGRTAVVTKENTAAGIAAMGKLQAEIENSRLERDNLPNMEWAKARIAELYIQSGDAKAATDLLASISVSDNKDLKKHVNKLKKML